MVVTLVAHFLVGIAPINLLGKWYGWTYSHHGIRYTLWYLFHAALVLWYTGNFASVFSAGVAQYSGAMASMGLLAVFAWYWHRWHGHLHEKTLGLGHNARDFLSFHPKAKSAKIAEIAFQDVVLLGLLGVVHVQLSPLVLYLGAAVLGGALHLMLVPILGRHIGLVFAAVATASAPIAVYLMLAHGFLYAFAFHVLMYPLILALSVRRYA